MIAVLRTLASLFPTVLRSRASLQMEVLALRHQLAAPARARLLVYDVGGRLIRTLLDANHPGGDHLTTWDGRDLNGVHVARGIYFMRLQAGTIVETRKVAYLGGN